MNRRSSFGCVLLVALGLACSSAVSAQSASNHAIGERLARAIGWYTGTAGRVDDEQARELLQAAAKSGDPISRMWLARCYSRGRMGLERDVAAAKAIAAEVIDEIRRLADDKVTEAVFLMGTAFDEGLGETENPSVAAAWFRRAADAGHVLGQHNLGNAYAAGRGVPQDDAAAVYWWRKAADAGDAITQLRLAEAYETGRGVTTDMPAAVRWYREASRRGNAQAAAALKRLGQ